MSWPLLYHSCLLHLFTCSLIHLSTCSPFHLFACSPFHLFTFSQSLTRLSRSRPHQPLPAAAGAAPSLTRPWAARQPGEPDEPSCSAPGARGSARGHPLRLIE